MIIINKKILIKQLHNCAKLYQQNLENRNIMFVYKVDGIKYIETKFTKANFLHLTGVQVLNNNLKAIPFYDKCIKQRLKESDIRI